MNAESVPRLTLTWLGHAMVLLELDGVRLLTDSVLRDRIGPLVRVAPSAERNILEQIDGVLLRTCTPITRICGRCAQLPPRRRCSPRIGRLRGWRARASATFPTFEPAMITPSVP